MTKVFRLLSICCLCLFLACSMLHATVTVSLTTSVVSPQPVGSSIVLNANSTNTNPGPVTYKFEVENAGATTFSLLSDYSLRSTFTWVPSVTDGAYTLRVTARDYLAQDYSTPFTTPFVLSSLVSGNAPAVSATNNNLVALFTAPPCTAGSTFRVVFKSPTETIPSVTPYQACLSTSNNIEIAPLHAGTTYKMFFQTKTGSTVVSDTHVLSFTSGSLPTDMNFPTMNVRQPTNSAVSPERWVLFSPPTTVGGAFATDLEGNVVWYKDDSSLFQLPRPVGGAMLGLFDGIGTGTGPYGKVNTKQQILRLFDLTGNILVETTADRVSEQLPTSDVPYGIDRFSHEARLLPNGNYLVLAETQNIFPAGTQGSKSPIDILGAIVLILDPNFQVQWYWNSFDHSGGGTQLDINRPPTLGEECSTNGNSNGCPAVLLMSPAVDWLHTNSLEMLGDGNILASMRDQDWVVKIDYNNGAGAGDILWRMGVGGDFTFTGTTEVYPWFSGQHDANFQDGQLDIMSVYDDGDTRSSLLANQHSRGQVLSVDESTLTVSYVVNADMGVLSYALGSAQSLSNGDWFFDNGEIEPKLKETQTIEVNASGTPVYNIGYNSTCYRAFRLPNFYSPPGT